MNLNEIPAWSDIESQPWFAELTPEEKQQSLTKWQGDMMQFAKDPKEKFAVAATSKAKARSFFGEEMPDDPIADALQRRQKDLEDIGSRYDAFSKGELEEDDAEVLTLNDTLKGNTPYSVIKGRLFVSPQLVWDKAAYEKVVNEAPVDEDERVLAMSAYDGSKERAAEGVVNSLGYTDEAFRDFAAKGFKEGKSNAAILDEWKANNKLPDGILGSLRGVGRQAYFGLRSGLSGLERAMGGLGGFFGSESAQKYAEESGKEAQSYMQRTLGEGPEFIGELTSGAVSIIPTMAAGAAASLFTEGAALPAAASITAGAIQSAGATQAETYEFYRNQGLDHANALAESRVDGLVSGLITGAITHYAGKLGDKIGLGKGIEGLFSGPASKIASKLTQREISESLKAGAKAVGGSFLQEGSEELLDQAAQDAYSMIKRDPTLTLAEAINNALQAGKVGAVLGGAAEAGKIGLKSLLNSAKFAVPTTEEEEALRAKFEVPAAVEEEVIASPEVQQEEQNIKTAADVVKEAAPVAPQTATVLAGITEEKAGELAADVVGATEDALASVEEEAPLVVDETPLVSPEATISPAVETAPISGTITPTEAGPPVEDVVTPAVTTAPLAPIPTKETPVASFQTSKGSTYDLLPDGTTVRNKAARPEHPGEEGIQPRSSKTIFVTEEGADALGIVQAEGVPFEIRQRKDGTWGAVALEGPFKGKFYKTSLISASEAPAVGLIPVELWDRPGKKQAVHFGNKITSVSSQPPQGQPVETPTNAAPEIPLEESLRQEPQDRVEVRTPEETGVGDSIQRAAEGEKEVAPQRILTTQEEFLVSKGVTDTDKLPQRRRQALEKEYQKWLKERGGAFRITLPVQRGGGNLILSDWKQAYPLLPEDLKTDLLRVVVNNRGRTATEQDVTDVMAFAEELVSQRPADERVFNESNLFYDISRNRNATPEIKARAQRRYEEAQGLPSPPTTGAVPTKPRSEKEVAVQKVFSALQRHLDSGGEFQIPGNPPVRVTKKNIGQFSVSEDGSLVFSRGKKGGKIPLPDVAVIGAQVGAPFDVLSLFSDENAAPAPAPAPVRSSALAVAESDNGSAFDRLVSLVGDRGKASEEIELLTSKDVFSAWPVLTDVVADSVAIQKGQEVDTQAKADALRQLYREAADLPPSKERADALEQIRLAASLNITNEETLKRRKKSPPTTGAVPTKTLPAGQKVTPGGVASPGVAPEAQPEKVAKTRSEKEVVSVKKRLEEGEKPIPQTIQALHYSREPLEVSDKVQPDQDQEFGFGFYAMEPSDEEMWKTMGRWEPGPLKNEVELTPKKPLVVTPQRLKRLIELAKKDGFSPDKINLWLSEQMESGSYDALIVRGFLNESDKIVVSKKIDALLRENWEPIFPKGKTSGKFVNVDEYNAAANAAVETVTGVDRDTYRAFERLQNQIFIPPSAAPNTIRVTKKPSPPTTGAVPTKTLPAGQKVTPGGVASPGVAPEAQPEQPVSQPVQAFRDAVSQMSPTAQAKWTPELRATAEAYLESGGTTGLQGLSPTQEKIIKRILDEATRTPEQEAAIRKADAEKLRQAKAKEKAERARESAYRESSLPPTPGKQIRKLGKGAMESVPVVLDEIAKVIPNIRELVEVRESVEGEPDAEGFYDPQADKAVVLVDNVYLKPQHGGSQEAALRETIIHELLHRGFAKLRQTNPQLFEQFEAYSITDTNDNLLDSLVRRGYTMYSNWRNDPAQAQKAREEVFVRKAALDLAVNGLDAIKSPTSLASQFFKWFKEFLSKLLGRVPSDNQLIHWTQIFLNAAQADFIEKTPGERRLSRDRDLAYSAAVQDRNEAEARRLYDEAALESAVEYPDSGYSKLPDALLGFGGPPAKGYAEQSYKTEITVAVGEGADAFVDGIKGLNTPHAMARAQRNWRGEKIRFIKATPYDPMPAGEPVPLSLQFGGPDIRYSLGEPPDMQEVKDRLNTFIDENKATNSFLEAFGPVRVERMQQQGEKLGPEYIQAQVRPLMQWAQAELGFEMDEEGNYVLSQRATDKAQSVLVKWLQDGRKFAKAYNKKAEKFFDKLFPGMEDIPVDSDMAAAVLLHEIMSYAKALAASSPKAEDQILLDMVRPQYGSVVLANYDQTMHKSGRTLQTARNYSEGTELGQDAVENANKKGEEKVTEELGDEALPSATEEGKVGLEAGVDAAPDIPAPADPTLRLLDLAVESLDEVAKAKAETVFRKLALLGMAEDALERAKKVGNKALSILTDPGLLAQELPSTVEELEALATKLRTELATDLADLDAALQGAKPETRKKVKAKAAATKSKTDSVQKLIDKLSKMPDESKEAKPKAETLRSAIADAIKEKEFDEQKVRDAATKFGATPEQTERLVEEAERLHEIAQDKTPSKTKLRKFLLSHPQETLYNPEQRQALVKTFLRNDVGMNDAEIARYLPKFESSFGKAMEDARKKYLDGLEKRFNAPKKARESRVDAQNRKLLQALRAGLAETKSPKVALLERLGFKEFKPTDKHVIAKLDAARTEALANGEFAKARLKQTELSSLLLRRRPPMGWMQLLNQAWITSALSSFRNLALNVWTPLGEAVSRYFGALAGALKTGDFTTVTALTKALGEAFRRVPARFKFAYSANTFTQQANAAIAEQASLIDEFRRSLSQLRDKKLSKKDRTKAATRVVFSFGDYSRRLLQSIDESWFSVLESFISSANLTSDINKYGIKAEALTEASVHFATQAKNDAYAVSQIVDRLSDYLDGLRGKTTAEIQQALELYRMDQLGISPENLAFTNEMLDVIEQLRLRSGAEGDALLKAAKRNINDYRRLAWVRAAEKADADTREWVSAVLTGKGVEKVDVDQVLKDATEGSERAASYGMGLHRVEEAPALDIGNTFAKMVEAMGQQAIRVNPMLGRMMVGFFGIPVNLMNKSLWFAPGYGALRYFAFRKMAERHPEKQFYAYSLANEKERAQRFREVIFGHAVFGLLAALGAFDDRDEEETEGLYVTLGGPANKTEKDAWLSRGFRPYSICIKHADGSVTSIPYGVGAGEFMKMPLMAAGAFDDMRLNKKLGNREDVSSALEYFNAFAAGVGRQATFLGAKNTVGALLPDTFGAGTVANLAFAAGNFFPFNGLDRSIETLVSGPPDRSRTGAILANIPYLRHFEALGARPATNVFGDLWGSKTADPIEIIEDRLLSQSISVWNTSKPLTGRDKKLYEFIGRYQVGPNGPQRGALELRNGYLTDQEWANYRDAWAANAKREWLSSLDRMARMDEDGRAKAAAELSTRASRKAKDRFNYK